jgi:hypothetical protein
MVDASIDRIQQLPLHIVRGERSFTPDFMQCLKERLPEEYDVYAEGWIDSENGARIPDIIIVRKNRVKTRGDQVIIEAGGVVAVVETKRSVRQAYEGLAQAVQYATFQLKCRMGFATNYFEVIPFVLGAEASVGRKQSFGTSCTPDTMAAVADYIVSVTVGKTRIVSAAEESLELLRSAIADIVETIKEIDTTKLKTPLGIMEELIWREEEEGLEEVDTAIRKASVYLVVNQILFYTALSSQIRGLRTLRSIRTMADLQTYFSEAYEIDYEPVFLPRVAENLPDRAVESVNGVISIITELQIDRLKHDVLGPLFHELIPLAVRKRLAAYYTENASADILARLAVHNADDHILDLSCGSGTLLVSCYNVKRELSIPDVSPGALHRKLLKEIYGCDITYFAAHLAVINLALREPLTETKRVLITAKDAFRLKPFGSTAFLGGRATDHALSLRGREAGFEIPEVDVVIQNPPFTSSKRIEGKYKQFLEAVISHKKRFFRKGMGLHAYFILHSDDFVKSGGMYAAVLPAALFNSDYGEGIKELLLDQYDIEYFVTSDAHVNFSEGCNFKELLLVARKAKSRTNSDTRFIVLKKKLTLSNSPDLAETIRTTNNDHDDDDLSISVIPKDELRSEWNWLAFTKPSLMSIIRKVRNSPCVKEGKRVVTIREGLVLVSPDFFYIPNRNWEVVRKDERAVSIRSKSTLRNLRIPVRFLRLTTRKPELHTTITPSLTHYLVSIPPDSELPEDLEEYIRYGEALEFKRQPSPREKVPYIIAYCRNKGIPWYSYVYSDLQTRKAKGHIGLVEKFRVKTRPCIAHYFDDVTTGSNNYSFGTSGEKLYDKVLAAWFNSSIFLTIFLAYKREIAGDYSRWKIADLNRYPCIDPTSLEKREVEEISKQLDAIRGLQLPTLPEQLGRSPRKELDLALLTAMRIPGPQTTLDNIYNALQQEIEKLH